ncbi:exopolyphosphatase [Flavobacterium psychrophilum]|uniref:Ppx/GppA phosphatase family protein n=1 Tax=Flavobacterium psychrophilum TaxID=96345 RepID=UPI0004F76233|nr:exopolyphosphatase [Flavobacterium psychrophilum]AIN73334.1 exopolyphosphatase [Flavobacterium psychrophilum FPG3]EKT2069686.1 exopolyphosphatase [Flavobacterium psychrophilum]EKT2071946.1 exopolyphosphatase [Flavobacterium psychrophilum]EKT3957767.1 exopolyphosphatase [Flavobacterium psychrophilum]EKT3962909.1 exopolyphosphatase [Flavobacterium psychrophilum]
MNIRKTLLNIVIFSFFFQNLSFSQETPENLFAGIEIGSKGIKMSVLDVKNIRRGDFEIKSYWSENIGIAKGIAIDGNLAKEDIDKAAATVLSNYIKIKNDFKVTDENIFIVGSSGVAMANNTQELIDKVKLSINKNLDFIDAQTEGKMLLKGCVPPSDYKDSIILDIGGGNTKGGYIDVRNNDTFVFFPLSVNYGTITLTEAVIKKTRKDDISEYNDKSFGFLPTLRDQVNAMYNASPVALVKDKIFMSGGAVWAFYTLYNGVAKENFNKFNLEDVLNYDAVLKNNFRKFEELAKTDKDVEKVLKTYSQKHLISGSNILLVCLEAIPKVNSKKLYFAKEGQIAWLVSYIADRSKKIKKIY